MTRARDIQDPEIKSLLGKLSYRNNLVREDTGFNEQKTREELTRTNSEISNLLARLGCPLSELTPELRDRIISNGYFLDIFNRFSEYDFGNIYLGHIIEARKTEDSRHLYLVCRSNEKQCLGISYPATFQRESSAVYTNQDITWMDFSKRFEDIDKSDPILLKNASLEQLGKLKQEGIRNYQKLGKLKSDAN